MLLYKLLRFLGFFKVWHKALVKVQDLTFMEKLHIRNDERYILYRVCLLDQTVKTQVKITMQNLVIFV